MRKFMRTRGAATPPPLPTSTPAPAHNTLKINGHVNGVGPAGDEHSSASRYRSGCGSSPPSRPSRPLWEDAQFPATWRSIGDKKLAAGVLWLRPYELCPRPTFRGERSISPSPSPSPSPSRSSAAAAAPNIPSYPAAVGDDSDEHFAARWSVQVGAVGDASVCCAAAALALTPRLLDRVAPPQTFRHPYTGAFSFKFWVFGEWRDVTVDDRLPTRGGVPLSSRGAVPDDFTLPLLEKAYAKLYGSYVSLRAGSVSRALQDLSGGVVQSFSLARQPRPLVAQVLHSAVPRATLVVATRPPARVYRVTGVDGTLVRVRAPAARADEWWPLRSLERRVGALVLVHVGPDEWVREPALRGLRPWRAVVARRRWRRGYNAGGPPSCTETTGTNPQFHVQVPGGGAHKVHVVVSVTQQYACAAHTETHMRLHAVGFAVYALPHATHPRPLQQLHALRALDVTHECRAREVVTFFTLPAGEYLVVPHTRRPHTDAAFLLRILTDEQTHVWEVNEDNVIINDLASEFPDEEQSVSRETRAAAVELLGGRQLDEVDAAGVRAALRRHGGWCGAWWRGGWRGAPSLDTCRALVPLRDARVRGAVRAADLPALVALVRRWRAAFVSSCAGGGCGSECSSYRARALLRAAGVCVSNKVLECVVVRFARGLSLSADAYITALARIHLAHERYRSLDAKLKSNPLSLEEMILMTIYS